MPKAKNQPSILQYGEEIIYRLHIFKTPNKLQKERELRNNLLWPLRNDLQHMLRDKGTT